MHKLLFPQEIEVYYVIPAMRREFALSLKKIKIDQKKIASLLHVSEAAVSQYLSGKRAMEVQFSDTIKKVIAKASLALLARSSFKAEGGKILELIKNDKTTCKVCMPITHEGADTCTLCFDLLQGKSQQKELVQIK